MKKWLLWLIVILVAALVVTAFVTVLLPFLLAGSNSAPTGELTLQPNADGSFALDWQKVPGADYYIVALYEPGTETPFFSRQTGPETGFQLPDQDGKRVTLRVTAGRRYEIWGKPLERNSGSFVEVTTGLEIPRIEDVVWDADIQTKKLTVSYSMKPGDTCVLSRQREDGSWEELQRSGESSFSLDYFSSPLAWNETATFRLSALRQLTGMVIYELEPAYFSVIGEDFMGREPALTLEDLGDNICALSWEETKGEYYQVQMRRAGDQDWTDIAQVTRDTPRYYESPQLEPVTEYEFRVLAVGGAQPMEGSPYAAISGELAYSTDVTARYCTVWPIMELETYADSGLTQPLATVAAGTTLCVLEEEGNAFRIMAGETPCYIDSRYCMIDVAEYLGSLCAYRITNSFSAIYLVHEYNMPGISGKVITGYEDILQGEDSYLVPLLYPSAKMLRTAAEDAISQGYRLKIYDAYRPHKATTDLYYKMLGILDYKIPAYTYTGKWVSLPKVEEGEELTYRLLMTNDTWSVSNFLAAGTSRHNQGVALDLTLESLETGEELKMQTSIHDLSWYSSQYSNNANAKLLRQIMEGAGFEDLVSEWWHFQDDGIRREIDLPALENGVSGEGWKADNYGWRYRCADGSYYRDCTVELEGKSCSFDSRGYWIDPDRAQ